jgi:hypothetical protein
MAKGSLSDDDQLLRREGRVLRSRAKRPRETPEELDDHCESEPSEPKRPRITQDGRVTLDQLVGFVNVLKCSIEKQVELDCSSDVISNKKFHAARERAEQIVVYSKEAIHRCSLQLERLITSHQASLLEMEEQLYKEKDWWSRIDLLSPGTPASFSPSGRTWS